MRPRIFQVKQIIAHFLWQRILLIRFIAWFGLANTCFFWIIGSKYIATIFASNTLFFTTFYAYSSFLGKCFVIFFTIMTALSHFALLAFLPLIFFIFPFILFSKNRMITLILAIIVGTVSVLLLLTDRFVFSLFHFHLNPTLIKIAFSDGNHLLGFFELSNQELFIMIVIGLGALILEIIMALIIWKKIILQKQYLFPKKIIALLLLGLWLSYSIVLMTINIGNNVLVQQTPNLPLYNEILATLLPFKNGLAILERFSETRFSQPLLAMAPLHYPLQPVVCQPKKHPYNIIMIGIDTWRFDSVSPELTPHINEFFANKWQFKNHFSGGNSTQAGLFSLFYGLPSNYWSSMLQQRRAPILLDEFRKQNYQIKTLFSSNMINPPFYKTIFYGLPNLRIDHAPGETVSDWDRYTNNEFIQFLKQRDKTRPFFGFIFYDSAHGYCTKQSIPAIYSVTERACERLTINKNNLNDLINRYQNAIHFLDNEIGKMFATLKTEKLLENTIIILTGDHGEEFDDNRLSYLGHGSNYTIYQVKTPLFIHWPKKNAQQWTHQTTHYDIAPTLLRDVLGCQNLEASYSIGKNLLNKNPRDFLLVGSYINMGIIQKNHIITLFTSGHVNVSDQHANEVHTKADTMTLSQALTLMRKFYR